MSEQGSYAEEGAGWGPRVLLPPAFVLPSQNVREEPIHILNVAIQYADHLEDEELVPIFRMFVQSKVCWACLWFRVTEGGGRGCCGEGCPVCLSLAVHFRGTGLASQPSPATPRSPQPRAEVAELGRALSLFPNNMGAVFLSPWVL